MDKFNDNLEQFTKAIKLNYPDQSKRIDEYYDYSSPGEVYLNEFITNCSAIGDDISSKNEIIFSKGQVILPSIDFHSIWNDDKLTDIQKDNIWKYLHTLYIFAYEHIKNVDFKTVVKELKQMGSDENIDEQTRTFMNIIDSLTTKYKEDKDSPADESGGGATPGNFNMPTPDLFGGVIGNLAKEIAEEIDPNKINLDDPAELLKSLLSGNFDENNDDSGVMNLIKDITNKIQNKISSGNLSETDLFAEAQNVMKSFGSAGGGAGGGAANPMDMFSSMMKSGMMSGMMPGMDPGSMGADNPNIVEQATNMLQHASAAASNNIGTGPGYTNISADQEQLKSTRDRLRKKLEEKKRLLALKESELVEPVIPIVAEEEIDLDALADEIEGL